jgi:hypothetical protein
MKENPVNTIWQSMTATDPSSIKTAEELKKYMSTPPPKELSRAQQHTYIDWRWKTEQPLLWRAVYRLFRRPIRRIIGAVLMQPQKPIFIQKP